MYTAKDIFPVLLYKGVPKDQLRKIVLSIVFDEQRDLIRLMKPPTSNFTDFQQVNCFSNFSHCMHQKDGSFNQNFTQRKNSATQNTVPAHKPSKSLSIGPEFFNNKPSIEPGVASGALPLSAENLKGNTNDNKFCVVVTLKTQTNKKNAAMRSTSCVPVAENIPQPKVDHCQQTLDQDTESLNPSKKNVMLPLNSIVGLKKLDPSHPFNKSSHKLYSHSESDIDRIFYRASKKSYLDISNEFQNALKPHTCNFMTSRDTNYESISESNTLSPETGSQLRQYTCELERPLISERRESGKELSAKQGAYCNIDYIKEVTRNRYNATSPIETKRTSNRKFKHQILGKSKYPLTKKKSVPLYKRLQKQSRYTNALSSQHGHTENKHPVGKIMDVSPLQYIYTDRVNDDSGQEVSERAISMLNKKSLENQDVPDKTSNRMKYVYPVHKENAHAKYKPRYGKKMIHCNKIKKKSKKESLATLKKYNTIFENISDNAQLHTPHKEASRTTTRDGSVTDFRITTYNRVKDRNKIKRTSHRGLYGREFKETANDFDFNNAVNNVFNNKTSLSKKSLKSSIKRIAELNDSKSMEPNWILRWNARLNLDEVTTKEKNNDELPDSFSSRYWKIENQLLNDIKKLDYARGVY